MQGVGGAIHLCRWSEIAESEELIAALDHIFYEASVTKSFASLEVRAAFRERWLGRYLEHEPQLAFLAFIGACRSPGALAGYVVGALADPARSDRYADIGYFSLLAEVTRRFPAHLHINLAPHARGRGWGSILIDRFVAEASAGNSPGVHVVTGAASRNTRFYRRNGFTCEHSFHWGGREQVLLGRALECHDGKNASA